MNHFNTSQCEPLGVDYQDVCLCGVVSYILVCVSDPQLLQTNGKLPMWFRKMVSLMLQLNLNIDIVLFPDN